MSSNTQVIDCGNALNIASVADIHQQLCAAINSSLPIRLKASNIEKVDVAGLQVLIAFYKEIEKSGGKVTWDNPSDTLKKAGVTLGLSHLIGLV